MIERAIHPLRAWWQRRGSSVLVVSGLPRSGTSLMMQMLSAGGVPVLTDNKRPPDESNPYGYYEYEAAKRLYQGHSEWMGQARGHAVKIISHQLKHLPADYDYRVIFMRRDVAEIVASQKTMLERMGTLPVSFDAEQLVREYDQHLIYITRWLGEQPNFRVHPVSHRQLIQDSPATIDVLCEFLDLPVDASAMHRVIDPQLYRHKAPLNGTPPGEV